jgi:hypothetical protein
MLESGVLQPVQIDRIDFSNAGMRIHWRKRGSGFGTITVFINGTTGQVMLDNETLSVSSVKDIFSCLVDNAYFLDK